MHPRLPRATLIPYTTLFRSWIKAKYGEEAVPANMSVAKSNAKKAMAGESQVTRRPRQLRASHATLPPSLSWRCFRSEEHTSELQSRRDLVCRPLLEKKLLRQ